MRHILSLLLFSLLFSLSCSVYSLEWIEGWQNTEAMTTNRAGAAVVKVGQHIYMLGGVDGVHFLATTEFAVIKPNGQLTPWRSTTALPEQRGFFSAVHFNGFIYAVGGGNGPHGKNLLRTIVRSKIQADGSLSEWQTLVAQLNIPRRCVKLIISDNVIYAFGGFGGMLLDSVERAEISADGSLSEWTMEENKLTLPRYVNAVKKSADRVYVIGGHRQNEGIGIAAVESAQLDQNNRFMKSWQNTAVLTQRRYALAAAVNDSYLYALGGLDGALYQDIIEKARIQADGSLSSWLSTTALPSPRANFSVVVDNNRIYIIGGTNRDDYYNTVEMAEFNSKGDIGFYATPQQAAVYQHPSTLKPTKTLLPNYGTVVEIIQTEVYSYLKVNDVSGTRWLATAKDDYKLNELVHYSRGLTMTNFYSRTLDKRFNEILFVERVERREE